MSAHWHHRPEHRHDRLRPSLAQRRTRRSPAAAAQSRAGRARPDHRGPPQAHRGAGPEDRGPATEAAVPGRRARGPARPAAGPGRPGTEGPGAGAQARDPGGGRQGRRRLGRHREGEREGLLDPVCRRPEPDQAAGRAARGRPLHDQRPGVAAGHLAGHARPADPRGHGGRHLRFPLHARLRPGQDRDPGRLHHRSLQARIPGDRRQVQVARRPRAHAVRVRHPFRGARTADQPGAEPRHRPPGRRQRARRARQLPARLAQRQQRRLEQRHLRRHRPEQRQGVGGPAVVQPVRRVRQLRAARPGPRNRRHVCRPGRHGLADPTAELQVAGQLDVLPLPHRHDAHGRGRRPHALRSAALLLGRQLRAARRVLRGRHRCGAHDHRRLAHRHRGRLGLAGGAALVPHRRGGIVPRLQAELRLLARQGHLGRVRTGRALS